MKPGGSTIEVFGLEIGGELRSMTHCGGGGGATIVFVIFAIVIVVVVLLAAAERCR